MSDATIEQLRARIDQLTQENELLKGVIERAKVGLAATDVDGRYVVANSWYEKRLGVSDSVVGKSFLDNVPPEHHAIALELQKAFFDGAPEPTRHWAFRDADGHDRELQIESALVTTSDGKRYKTSTLYDVTDQRTRDARLSLFGTVLDSAPFVLFALDASGIFTLAEGKGLANLGSKPGEWVGRNALEDWKGTTAEPNMRRALAGESFRDSLSIPGPLHYDVWYLPIRNGNGQLDGMIGLALDVTTEKVIESELREKLATIEAQKAKIDLFNRALDSAPIVLWTIDEAGNYTLSEGKGLELLGFKSGEVTGLNALEMFREQPIEGHLRGALAGQSSTLVAEAAPGVYFDSWYLPLTDGTGKSIGAMGLGIDASARMEKERELREKLELIERQSSTIRALATPIIRVWDEVLCLPVIGTVDSQRTADMMTALLESIVSEQARFAIIDLTGVAVVDTTTADHLIRLFKAARVLGVDGVLCGIQPAVAQTVVALGMDLGDVVTMRTLEEALKWCIAARNREQQRGISARQLSGNKAGARS